MRPPGTDMGTKRTLPGPGVLLLIIDDNDDNHNLNQADNNDDDDDDDDDLNFSSPTPAPFD